MLKEDGTSYLNRVEVKTSISLNGQEITATPTVTAENTSFDPTGTEYAPESTNLSLTSIESINRIKTLEDAPVSGETSIKRKTTTVTELANLADYIGEWYLIHTSPVSINTLNKMNFQLSFNASGSVTVDLKLTDNSGVNTVTYNNGFATVNAEATVNLNSGATVYDFIIDEFIQCPENGMQLQIKVNNTNLSDPLKVLETSKEVIVTTTTQNVYIMPGV